MALIVIPKQFYKVAQAKLSLSSPYAQEPKDGTATVRTRWFLFLTA